jgi:hypothetical protein
LHLPAGEAGNDRSEIVQVGFMDYIVRDAPTLPTRLYIFDHLVYRPDKYIRALKNFVRR